MACGAIDADELAEGDAVDRGALHVADQAAQPQLRRRSGLEVDVRGALIDGELEQLLEIHDRAPWADDVSRGNAWSFPVQHARSAGRAARAYAPVRGSAGTADLDDRVDGIS